jgi:hypothetical protein
MSIGNEYWVPCDWVEVSQLFSLIINDLFATMFFYSKTFHQNPGHLFLFLDVVVK